MRIIRYDRLVVNRRFDILLHPIRLRIVMVASGRTVTIADLARSLPDVAQATLYRQVAVLVEAGILEITDERPVRGTVERTYALNQGAATIDATQAHAMSAEEHLEAFTIFAGTLIDAYGRYLASPDAVPADDGVSYRQVPLWLDDDEFAELAADVAAAIARHVDNEPEPGRRRRLLTEIIMPDADQSPG